MCVINPTLALNDKDNNLQLFEITICLIASILPCVIMSFLHGMSEEIDRKGYPQ